LSAHSSLEIYLWGTVQAYFTMNKGSCCLSSQWQLITLIHINLQQLLPAVLLNQTSTESHCWFTTISLGSPSLFAHDVNATYRPRTWGFCSKLTVLPKTFKKDLHWSQKAALGIAETLKERYPCIWKIRNKTQIKSVGDSENRRIT